MIQVLIAGAGISTVAGIARAAGVFGARGRWISYITRLEVIVPLLGITYLIIRSIMAGFPALAGTDVVLVILGIVVLPAVELTTRRSTTDVREVLKLWAAAAAAGLVLVALFPGIATATAAPVPALRSAWPVLHVGTTMAGEASFLVGAGAATASLLSRNRKGRLQTDREIQFFRVSSAAISVGYPLFTLGALVFGSLWAFRAWGRYWAWDPKEVWALITWLVYTLYLHLQLMRGGSRSAEAATEANAGRANHRVLLNIIAIVGILLALFTFAGVNLLFESIHSY